MDDLGNGSHIPELNDSDDDAGLLQGQKLSRAETFARSKNREIFDKNFREQ